MKNTTYITKCLNDTKTESFICNSRDGISSRCDCGKFNNSGSYFFHINNTDLYSNIDEIDDMNITQDIDNIPSQMNKDCYQLEDKIHWNCFTSMGDLSKTICHCCNWKSIRLHTKNYIDTKLVFRGLQNLYFPLKYQNEKNSISDSMHQNITNQESIDYQYSLIPLTTIIPIFICLIIFILVVISLILKNMKRYNCIKYSDKADDLSLLLSNT